MKKSIVVLTGAGVSAESGIKTFRDNGGLWENHDIMEVASPLGWQKNKSLVLDFYNQRRRQLLDVRPNPAHLAIAELEKKFDVTVVTQNVDDLHERAGSNKVIHLHGELLKSRSSVDETLVYECRGDIKVGDKCEKGSQLRPHIVWFGEMVPLISEAATKVGQADIVMIVGTSMQVYPAAGLVENALDGIPIFYIDPRPSINYELQFLTNLRVIAELASSGVRKVVDQLLG